MVLFGIGNEFCEESIAQGKPEQRPLVLFASFQQFRHHFFSACTYE